METKQRQGFKELKEKHKNIRDSWKSENSQSTKLRVHRALSWLKSAEESDNDDIAFISLWVAFNSMYGREATFSTAHVSEKLAFKQFFSRVIDYDSNKTISAVIWSHYSNLFRLFIDNQFVFAPFWEYQVGTISEEEWKKRFAKSKKSAEVALGKQDSATFLGIVFERLYILRNQLMHGGATFNSMVNREQMKQGEQILFEVIPRLIDILMDNPEIGWGAPAYPPIEEKLL